MTSRHSLRSIVTPCVAACSSASAQCSARFFLPPTRPAPSESTPTPYLPAVTMPDAEHGTSVRHVVELHEAIGHHQRVMVRQAHHTRAELDPPGALARGRDHEGGVADDLPAGRMVLADPRLLVAELIDPLDQLEVA